MVSFSVDYIQQNSVRGLIEGLAEPASYYRLFEVEVWNYSGSSHIKTVQWTENNSNRYAYDTVTGLSSGTSYMFKGFVRNQSARVHAGTSYATTLSPPAPIYVGAVSYVSAEASTNDGSRVYVTWGSASNATSYGVEIYLGYGTNNFVSSQSVYGNSTSFSGLSEGTTYTVKVFGRRDGSSNGGYSTDTVTTLSYNVGSVYSVTAVPSTTTAGRVSVTWSYADNATSYGVEVYRGYSTSSSDFVTSQSVSGTSTTFSLNDSTTYTIKVFGRRSGYSNGYPATTYVTTYDLTPPTISYSGMSGLGGLQLSWSASDVGSGLRNSNRFQLYVGTAGGSEGTLKTSGYTNSYSNTWLTDANGYGLVVNSYYWVGVRAFDNNDNQSSLLSRQIQYKINRPSSWAWDYTKTSGQNINLTALEWNGFLDRINLFRVYRGYSNYTFTRAVRGNPITASIINESILAMNILSPPTSLPSTAVKGGNITAGIFNSLRNSLNSIT